MKPVNKNAAYIQDVRLRENKPWYRSPCDGERNTRRFWKRQASKAQRYRPATIRFDSDTLEAL